MTINWVILVIVLVAAAALVIFLIKRNLKDEKDVTKYFNDEYKSNTEKENELDKDDI